LRDARVDLVLAADELTRLENALDTATAAQWAAADESEKFRGQVAELVADKVDPPRLLLRLRSP
jgi:hypothetical protein